jgi:hypothetical protein
MKKIQHKLAAKLLIVGTIFLSLPSSALGVVVLGEKVNFFVDPDYDLFGREEITATLQKVGRKTYFYLDYEWWKSLQSQEKSKITQALQLLDDEFYKNIYPTITSNFGSEWNLGIDGDSGITVLIHPMKEGAGGYFNNGDEYLKIQNPKSNEREMVYSNANYITSPLAKSFLAHEFVHLITFNQKEKKNGVEEEVWLNEARAEYAPTLVGYDSEYEGSNLQRRVNDFLKNPSDSITEWLATPSDYGALNLFTQYLVEQYGIKILADSLKSKEAGIKSLNEALVKNGVKEDFSQIFTDWTIAVLVNDCSIGSKYCYGNENLKNLRVSPSINFLPLKGISTLGVSQSTKNWSGNWFKFIGSNGTLKIELIGNPENLFKVPYAIRDYSGKNTLKFFNLDEYQRGEILVPEFGTKVASVTIIPSIQSKTSGFSGAELSFPFFWEASTITAEEKENPNSISFEKPISEMTKGELLIKISEIEKLLGELKSQLTYIEVSEEKEKETAQKTENNPISCQKFEEDLFYGLRNDNKVKCLQEFLNYQGKEIYPEGLVTGNFLSLTKEAVVRFQEKYSEDILKPFDLLAGTGYVGEKTRIKINELLSQ